MTTAAMIPAAIPIHVLRLMDEDGAHVSPPTAILDAMRPSMNEAGSLRAQCAHDTLTTTYQADVQEGAAAD